VVEARKLSFADFNLRRKISHTRLLIEQCVGRNPRQGTHNGVGIFKRAKTDIRLGANRHAVDVLGGNTRVDHQIGQLRHDLHQRVAGADDTANGMGVERQHESPHRSTHGGAIQGVLQGRQALLQVVDLGLGFGKLGHHLGNKAFVELQYFQARFANAYLRRRNRGPVIRNLSHGRGSAALQLPQTRSSRLIDPLLMWIGNWISWLWLVLMLVICINVALRYFFSEGQVELEESQWHLYSAGFLLGLSYAFQADAHIRIDVLSERLSQRTRAWLELYGILLGLLPFMLLILFYSVPFVMQSFALNETSQSPGGLSHRWIIKSALPTGFALLLLAAWSRFTRVWCLLFADEAGKA
jgi:TRAP-type mannitol/chloroaromatic compound transport system permease small subunit